MEEITNATDKVASLLEKLADQLGVTVTYLWGVLVKAQVARGINELIAAGVFIAVGIAGLCFIRKAVKVYRAEKERLDTNGHDYFQDSQAAVIVSFSIVGGLALVVSLPFAVSSIQRAILRLTQPEFAALHQLMEWLRQ